jgi:hypothetical protein
LGAKIVEKTHSLGHFQIQRLARNFNKKGPVVKPALIAGEGFEPPTFGL